MTFIYLLCLFFAILSQFMKSHKKQLKASFSHTKKWLQVSQRYLKLEFVQKSSLCECYLIINQHLSVPSFELYNYLNVVLLIITQHQMKCQSLINGPYSLKSLRQKTNKRNGNLQPTASIILGNVQIELWCSRKNPG